MCGIVGALSFTNAGFNISEEYILKMRDVMIHRGPDGSGVWISPDRQIGLGHRRLSIIDLSVAANQPMSNQDGRFHIVFNGEIYNHSDIRKELESTGKYFWKTDHSDTEVILHAFEEWGIDCVHRFRGMFAIALWDDQKKELWLIRDRIGVKPLYYSIHNCRIVFASEIKALLEDPDQTREVNEEGFFDYLSFLTVPAPNTLFKGIYKLPNATILRVNADGNMEEWKYWDVLDFAQPMHGISEEEITQKILAELRTAVKLRKVSDVPVGVFLSGGIDSSTNAALFSEGETSTVKTFSIGYKGNYESYQNETKYAKLVSDQVGAEYHEKLLTSEDLISFIPRMVSLQDEPIADPVCVPVYYVSKLARDNGVIVCQVGEGADELFWGYPYWKISLKLQKLSDLPIPFFLRKATLRVLSLLGRDKDWRFEYLRRSSENQPIFWGGAEIYTQVQKSRLLSKRLNNKMKNRTSWDVLKPIYERFQQKSKTKAMLDWMSYLDLNLRLPELLLMRVDKMSMGTSLEARVPFLDHKFVELAMSIPSEIKMKNDQLKYILKKSVRGIIPDVVIDRKKQGFAAPMKEWFEEGLGDVARQELKEFCMETDLLNWTEVERLLNGEKKSNAWPLLNVAQWWKIYIKKA